MLCEVARRKVSELRAGQWWQCDVFMMDRSPAFHLLSLPSLPPSPSSEQPEPPRGPAARWPLGISRPSNRLLQDSESLNFVLANKPTYVCHRYETRITDFTFILRLI